MSPQIWLAALSVLVLGLTAFTVLAATKARSHRMGTDRRLEQLGRELFEKSAALDRRCDDLRAAIGRLETLADRVRLLEVERELDGLAARGRLGEAAAERLEAAAAALRQDLGGGAPRER